MSMKLASDKAAVLQAVEFLKAGEIVALPTETVYGLAADATNETAVAKIFEAKGRPANNPLIVHVPSMKQAQSLIDMNDKARALAQAFWPGALTIIGTLKSKDIAPNVTAGLDTLAVRIPSHGIFQDILKQLGKPIAAPSANGSGHVSASSPKIVADTLHVQPALILASGITECGLESTIIDCTNDVPVLLRYGAISQDRIKDVVGVIEDKVTLTNNEAPKSPGQLLRHYAPRTSIRMNAVDVREGEALLAFGSTKFMAHVHGGYAGDVLPSTHLKNLSDEGDLEEAAHHLFAYLHDLDLLSPNVIAVMPIPDKGIGQSINDRLRRACHAQKMG